MSSTIINFCNKMKKTSTPNKCYYIYGKHPFLAALINPKRVIHEILITKENLSLLPDHLSAKAKILTNSELIKILPRDSIHQGFALLVSPLNNMNLESFNFTENSKIAILDQVTDPHNLGAILRSAAAFGIEAIIIPSDNTPEESAIVAKTACGALEHIPVCRVTNISSTIQLLKKNHFWVIGLDGEATDLVDRKLLSGRICLVLGAEGKGMRRLTRENCDLIAKIPILNTMESLNVSNAAAIAFYEAYLAKK